jgi:hypothetical protein
MTNIEYDNILKQLGMTGSYLIVAQVIILHWIEDTWCAH